jgi:hypothetical protein
MDLTVSSSTCQGVRFSPREGGSRSEAPRSPAKAGEGILAKANEINLRIKRNRFHQRPLVRFLKHSKLFIFLSTAFHLFRPPRLDRASASGL